MNRRALILLPLLLACGPFFYPAPPPLEAYPQRTPGKGWHDLFQESRPAAADAQGREQIIAACRTLVGDLPGMTVAERLRAIDELQSKNRAGDFSGGVATFLHELRELAAQDAALEAAADYLAWRIPQPGFGTGAVGAPPERRWDWDQDAYEKALAAHHEREAAARKWLDDALIDPPPVLKPHLMVCRAEFHRASGRPEDALAAYQEVMAEFPDHPRAEVAAFMKGRCRLDRARMLPRDAGERRNQWLSETADEFEDYLTRHPAGRFVADAHGWLGGVATDRGDLIHALACHLKRLEIQPERETLRSTLRECDRIFAAILTREEAADDWQLTQMPWKEIVAQPEFARLLVYQAMDPAAREELIHGDRNLSSDRATIDFLERRIVRPERRARMILALLGEAVAAAKGGQAPDAFTLGVLGWSSLQSADFPQAEILFTRALAQEVRDDLFYGKARALSGLGRHQEAWKCYQTLVEDFRGGPLEKFCAFEAALARYHAGEAGEAMLMLLAMRDEHAGLPMAPLRPMFQAAQWIDTMAQFAPLEQLAAPLGRLPEDAPEAAVLRAVVRTRALCAGDYATARRHLDPPQGEQPGEYEFDELPRGIQMTEAIWNQEVEPMLAATRAITEAPDHLRAARHLRLARMWQAQRGRLTLPLHHLFDYSRSETEKLEQLRRKNAALLGLDAAGITAELDSRDELHHALGHFLAAAETADPDVAAPALEAANEVLFRMAEFSLYRSSRAAETDSSALSGKLVARLREDFPDRPETKRAVVWNFAPPALLGRWMPGDYNPANSANGIAVAVVNPQGTHWDLNERDRGDEDERLRIAFQKWLDSPTEDMAELHRELEGFRAEFDRARRWLSEREILSIVDDLDDLASVAAMPGVTRDLMRRYIAIRRGGDPVPPVAGEWQPLAPWLDFLVCLRRGDPRNELPTAAVVRMWSEYLKKHPDGPKSEAASLRLLRLKVRAIAPVPQVQAFHFPDSPIPHGYKRMKSPPASDPAEVRALSRELDAHEQRYPAGRYRADLMVLRAAVASQTGDYRTALKCLAEVLADPAHPELRQNAALYFAEISLRLLDRHHRPALAAAFRQERQALPFLKNLAHGDTCVSRLRPLLAWLEE